MSVNDLMARALGVRVVPDRYLEGLGYFDHRRQTAQFHKLAWNAVRVMERCNGKRLTPALKRKADDYARSVLGHPDYAPWLYVYAAMRGEFLDGWMPDNFYHLIVAPRVNKGLPHVTALKSFSNVVLKTEALPDIACLIDGQFYDRDLNRISRTAVAELARPYGHVYVKRDGGGRGVSIAKLSAEALADHAFRGDCVVQRPIRQHPLFEEIVTGSVATLRVTTARGPDGAITQRGAYLRLGRAGTEWVQTDNSIRVAIKDSDGALDAWGYASDWRAFDAHPDTGAPLQRRRVPGYAHAVELCLTLHARVPHLVTVGWDVAINRDCEPELLEWNGGHGDIKFLEALSGPHYRDMNWERFAKRA